MLIKTKQELDSCLEYFKNHTWIALDTETTGRDPHTDKFVTIQLGDRYKQFVIDCRYIPPIELKEFIESKGFILHNSKFDYKFLKAANINLEKIHDTMLAELVIYCGYEGFGWGLKDLVNRYCNVEMSKEVRSSFSYLKGELNEKQIEYAAKDVRYLHDIMDKQLEVISKYDLGYCLDLENEAIKALADIEYNGMLLNGEKWIDNTKKYELKLEELRNHLDRIIIEDPILSKHYKLRSIQTSLFEEKKREVNINYSSHMQIRDLLSKLGIELESTDARNLKKVKGKHIIIPVLLELRGVEKVISTYGYSFLDYINKSTGRVHTDFWPILNTGRVSSNDPNLQNIPHFNEFRNCFEVRPGYKWMGCDYSAQELRLMADGSDEPGFIDVLNRGEDLHCYVGSMMFQRPITKQDKELRNQAKTINFGKPLILAA